MPYLSLMTSVLWHNPSKKYQHFPLFTVIITFAQAVEKIAALPLFTVIIWAFLAGIWHSTIVVWNLSLDASPELGHAFQH